MKEYEVHPYALIFPPMSKMDFETLTLDLRANGLRDPITIFEGQIIDGRNRYRACVNLGITPRFEEYYGDDPLAFVISKNLARRHLDESQRAMVGARLANMKHGQREDYSRAANLPVCSQPEAATRVNVSERSVRSARKVIDKVEKDEAVPELAAAVDNGQIAVSVAAKIADLPKEDQTKILSEDRPEVAIKKVERAKKEQSLAARQEALPVAKFGVIYADPEWRFETFSENGKDRSADNHYPTSDTETIMGRDVSSIAAQDCALFLWATAPMIRDALRVMEAWGFEYKSQFIWVKDRAGTGYWNRNRHEILLVGTRGAIPAPAPGTQWPSAIEAPVGRHSEKPEVFRDLIEAYFPSLPKIELNCRGAPRDGWSAWGNEAEQAA